MSRWSGKADLADHIAGMGGWYDKDGNPVKFGQEGVGCYYSDELQDFEAFKKATGGVLHQHYLIKVSEYNQEFVKNHCQNFDYIKHVEKRPNKACKSGSKEYTYYTYTYWGKEYDLKGLNKHGVYIDIEIHFNTLLDLIPYYPYIVGAACCENGKQYVVISNRSYVEREFEEHLSFGHLGGFDYKKELQDHYLEVCKNYYLVDYDKRVKEISLIGYKPLHNGYYELLLPSAADYMHDIKFVWEDGKNHPHWTSPKLEDEYTVLISEQDIENYLYDDIKKDTVKIRYVEKLKNNLRLS